MIEGLLVALVVGAAALYLGRRAWMTLRGRSCGCAASASGKGCPAAELVRADIERATRDR